MRIVLADVFVWFCCQTRPLDDWLPFRASYLDEHLRLDGRGWNVTFCCADCQSHDGYFRCMECFGLSMLCKDCLLRAHKVAPLHRIEVRLQLSFFILSHSFLHLCRLGTQRVTGARRHLQLSGSLSIWGIRVAIVLRRQQQCA